MTSLSAVCRVIRLARLFGWFLFSVSVFLASTWAQTPIQPAPGAPTPQVTPGTAQPAQPPNGKIPGTAQPAEPQSNGANSSPAGGTAQDQPDQDAGVFVFKKKVEEVVLHATVVDGQRHLVPNLDRNTFSVFENGTPQVITAFHRDDVPVAMGIVIDNSGSMREKRAKVNGAVLNLLRDSNPLDEIFVVNFSRDCYLDQDFTSDLGLVQAALQKVTMQGSTALYDAIVASAVHLSNNPHLENKVLLVITDGRDNASRETLREARLRLQRQNGPTLYAIGLLGSGLEGQDRDTLADLAASSGGAAFFPATLEELDDISRTIGHDIRSRYTIGYKSSNPNQNGGYRAIQVEAQARGYAQLTVRTRKGYYPGEALR